MDADKITYKIMQLDEYLTILNQIGKTEKNSFLKDNIVIGSAKYYLQVSIEVCLDIASHIIASEHLRAPKDYADSFSVLNEAGFIASELCLKLRQMAKFRNRLVHLYGEIDNEYIYEFLKSDLQDFYEYEKKIVTLVKGDSRHKD